jgi:hypothetical protein
MTVISLRVIGRFLSIQSPVAPTMRAARSRFELMVKPAAFAAPTLTSSRTRFRSVRNRTMPRLVKPAVSPTVNVGWVLVGLCLRSTDEQDVAGFDVLDAAKPCDRQLAALDDFSLDHLIEESAERIVAQHADDNRGVRAGKRVGRPVDELNEVEQEDGLDLALVERRALRRGRRCDRKQRRDHPHRLTKGRRPHQRPQNPHAILAYMPRSTSPRCVGAPNSA